MRTYKQIVHYDCFLRGICGRDTSLALPLRAGQVAVAPGASSACSTWSPSGGCARRSPPSTAKRTVLSASAGTTSFHASQRQGEHSDEGLRAATRFGAVSTHKVSKSSALRFLISFSVSGICRDH
jgi:hypothetical protein